MLSAVLLPWYTIWEIPKCFSSEPLIWASLTLSYGLYCYFKEKLLSNTWIFKHLFSFWIPLSQRSFISENYHQRLRNLKIFTNSYIKIKQVVKVMDLGVKGKRLQTICTWWYGLRSTKDKKDQLDFSLSIQLCSDIRVNSNIHHQFKIISLWLSGCLRYTSYVHPPESHSELEEYLRTLQSRTPAPYPPMTLSWVNNTCFLKKYRDMILLLY